MIVALYLIGLRKNKLSVVGLSWFYLPLLVMVFFNYLFANRGNEILLPEHNLYFCYPGFVIFLFSTISIMKLKINTQKYLAAVFLVVLAFYAGSTISENFIWQDEIGLFKNNMKYNKDSAFNFITYANLGLAYERAEKLSLAEENLRLSAEKSGGNPYFYNLLASFYIRNFKFDQAIKTLTYSKELDENFYSTYLLLGISYAEKRQDGQALQNFQKARMLNPSNPIAERYLKILENTQVINESG